MLGQVSMKLIYLANARIPTEKAHGLQIASMCSAFADAGVDVELVLPKRNRNSTNDLFSYYGLKKNFSVTYLPSRAVHRFGFLNYWINQVIFTLAVFRWRESIQKSDIIFTRDEWSGYVLRLLGYPVFYDMHGFPEYKRWLWKLSMRSMNGVVGTNQWKLDQAHEQFGIPRERMLLARNGYDAALFPSQESKQTLRVKFGFPSHKPIVLYTGHLYDWKGAHTLAVAAALVPEAFFVFVGGSEKDCMAFREKFETKNLVVVGQKPHTDMPHYLAAADILVVPNSQFSSQPRYIVYSQFDTSPIKLFEYMASGVPMVVSNLSSIREVVDSESAFFAEPDMPADFARVIRGVLAHPEEGKRRAKKAKEMSAGYTLSSRAHTILGFIQKK